MQSCPGALRPERPGPPCAHTRVHVWRHVVASFYLPAGLIQRTVSQEHWQCCTQRVCWEDLGQLSRDALMMVAGAALQQLGLCQHLLKDYANARLMIDKARA